jgi:hypothetical protein
MRDLIIASPSLIVPPGDQSGHPLVFEHNHVEVLLPLSQYSSPVSLA